MHDSENCGVSQDPELAVSEQTVIISPFSMKNTIAAEIKSSGTRSCLLSWQSQENLSPVSGGS